MKSGDHGNSHFDEEIAPVAPAAGAFTAPSFAATKPPHTKAACEKAHMAWDAATKKCS